MDDLLAELDKIEGAKEIAAKLRTALDGHRGDSAAAEKRAAKAEKEIARLKAELETAGKGADETTKAAQREREEALAEAEKARAELASERLRVRLEKRLGITDETKSRRAVAAFLEHAGEDVSLDDKGTLIGADKALESFKAAEPFWFEPPTETPAPVVQIGARPGSGPGAARPAGSAATKQPQSKDEKVEAWKARQRAATDKKKAG